MRFVLSLVSAVAVATNSLVVYAQTSAGSNRVLSPTTVAYRQQHDNGDGTSSLDLLVLWRGNPGWFLRGGSSSSSGDTHGGFGQWQAARWMSYGRVTLTLNLKSTSKDFDSRTTVVTLLDREIAPRETNVVLVDGASGAPTPLRRL